MDREARIRYLAPKRALEPTDGEEKPALERLKPSSWLGPWPTPQRLGSDGSLHGVRGVS